MATSTLRINITAELERLQQTYIQVGDDEIKIKCPFHADTDPSCFISITKQVFNCFACKKDGDVFSLLAGILRTSRAAVLYDLSNRYVNLREEKMISAELVDKYFLELPSHGNILRALKDRGVTDALIQQYKLGYDTHTNRVTIPIRNYMGVYVNIRKYMPGAADKKFTNIRGHSEPRLYPIEQLKYDNIVICGGELKAVAAAAQLNTQNIGAISTTCSEMAWHKSFTKAFVGKNVWVCYDIDAAGRRGADYVCGVLYRTAESVRNILLPLNPTIYPKGDVSDFIGLEKGDLLSLLDTVELWKPPIVSKQEREDAENITDITLADAFNPEHMNRLLGFSGCIAGEMQETWMVPKTVRVDCPRDRDYCGQCAILHCKQSQTYEIQGTSNQILNMIEQPDKQVDMAVKECLAIPSICKVSAIEVTKYRQINLQFVQPTVNMQDEAQMVELPIFCIDSKAAIGDTVEATARLLKHPKNQTAVLLSDKCKSINNDKLENLEELQIFRPAEWSQHGLEWYLSRRYNDFELNVTNIYCRHKLHLIMDLTYHSVLTFKLGNDTVNGWIHTLVLGDTSQGKSKTFDGLKRHYGLGNKIDCKNSSAAGILGGVAQYLNRSYIKWGAIVKNDRGLLCLEESKYMSEYIIGQLTNTFSEGVARIEKIGGGTAYARTRMIMMSNPIDNPYIKDFSYGVKAIAKIMGCVEDVRRLDIGFIVSKNDVNEDDRYAKQEEVVDQTYTAMLCRKLVMWAWSRQMHHVIISDVVHQEINDAARFLTSKFSDSIPLVDSGSMREKVARLAAALAALTFSTDDTYARLIILPCHVEYIKHLYLEMYSSEHHGYSIYSEEQTAESKIFNEEEIRSYVANRVDPSTFVRLVVKLGHFTVDEWKVALRLDPDNANKDIGYLIENNCIELVPQKHRTTRSYYNITSAFRTLLRTMMAGGLPTRPKDF